MASKDAREADARTFMEASADPVGRAPAETTAMASTAPVRATTPVATADGLGLPSLSSAVAVDPPLAPSAACAEGGVEQLAAPLGDLNPREGGRRFDLCLVGDASAALISWVLGVSPQLSFGRRAFHLVPRFRASNGGGGRVRVARCGVRWFEFVSWAVRATVSMPTATCRSSRTVVASASACSPRGRVATNDRYSTCTGRRPNSITRKTGW